MATSHAATDDAVAAADSAGGHHSDSHPTPHPVRISTHFCRRLSTTSAGRFQAPRSWWASGWQGVRTVSTSSAVRASFAVTAVRALPSAFHRATSAVAFSPAAGYAPASDFRVRPSCESRRQPKEAVPRSQWPSKWRV